MSRNGNIKSNPNESFICNSCGRAVPPVIFGGSQRNHCPYCLTSRHMDILPGDRRAACRGTMKAISIWVQDNREWSLIHRCERCGVIRTNRIAADDNEMLLFTMAASFLSQLPFPAARTIIDLKSAGQENTVHE